MSPEHRQPVGVGRVRPDEVEDDVGTPPVRRLTDCIDRPTVEDLFGAELRGESATALVRVEREDVARAELPDELEGDVPHATDPDDGDRGHREEGVEPVS